MSVDGHPAGLLATGARGSLPVTIPPGTSTFTLTYGVDPNEPLAVRTVTAAAAAGSPAAAAAPCTAEPADTATQLTATITPHAPTNAQATPTTRYGHTATITGTLTNAQGVGVPTAAVCLVAQDNTEGAPMQLEGSTTTAPNGQFTLSVPIGPSRTLWVLSNGATSILASTLQDTVRSKVTLHPKRKHLHNGQVLALRGSLPGPFPSGGVLVLVQVWRGTYWETFEDTHTNANGHYTARYRFHFTTITTTYRMRTFVPKQSSYPYVGNHSHPVLIHVRG